LGISRFILLASSCPRLAHENEFIEKRRVAATGVKIYYLLHFSLARNEGKTNHLLKIVIWQPIIQFQMCKRGYTRIEQRLFHAKIALK